MSDLINIFDNMPAELAAAIAKMSDAYEAGYGKDVVMPPSFGWDKALYDIAVNIKKMPDGRRKGYVAGWTPWDSMPYQQCRTGNQYYVDPVTGNDTTGTGTQANPFKTRDKAQTVANTAGNPCTIWVKASGQIGRTSGGIWGVLATVATCYMAYGGTVITGAFADYAYTADGTNAWVYRTARTGVCSVYSKVDFDTFGNFRMLKQVFSLAECARVAGSWFQDTADVCIHTFDGAAPVNATIMVLVKGIGSGMEWNFGNSPQHQFFDGETPNDGWEVRGLRLKTFATAYGTEPKIVARRRLISKYCGYTDGDQQHAIGVDNWWGIEWNEDVHIHRAAYDGFNKHNSLGMKPLYALNLNCSSIDCGVFAPAGGSMNNFTLHENVIAIDVAGVYDMSRGGNIANINTTQMWSVGTRSTRDRGDIDVTGGVNRPTEVRARDSAKIWMEDPQLTPQGGGFAISSDSVNAVQVKGVYNLTGKVVGAQFVQEFV